MFPKPVADPEQDLGADFTADIDVARNSNRESTTSSPRANMTAVFTRQHFGVNMAHPLMSKFGELTFPR